MESGGKGEDVGFDVFREGGFAELLGAGGFGGVGEILDLGDEDMDRKVRVGEGYEEVGAVDGFFLRSCPSSAFPAPPSSSPPSSSSFRMLCFGGDDSFPGEGSNGLPQKSGASGNDSYSSTSSSSSNSSFTKLKKKTEETRGCSAAAGRGRASTTATTTATRKGTATSKASTGAAPKKPRKEQTQQRPTSLQGRTLKVRKENLGERITALQQLVSPFGKSDTASVLHEALGYIRFLHGQVQVLSSPYLQRQPSSDHLHEGLQEGGGEGEPRRDLRSRGLCLVPVANTARMAGSNGADFWSPAMGSSGLDYPHPEVSEH